MHTPSCIFFCLLLLTVTRVASFPIISRAGVFGSCSNPNIIFANGLDGRNGPAFAPANSADFNHGSALDIGIISSFICGQLSSKCDAGQGAISACASASAAASKETGQAAAATFNSIISSAASSSSQQSQQSNSEGQANNTQEPQNNTQQQQQEQQQQQQKSTSSGGGNLQHFTGSLGGAAPAVTSGGKGFVVAGSDDFVNLSAALGRSCDIQHNACADAANSGNSNFSVNDCDTQDAQCRASI